MIQISIKIFTLGQILLMIRFIGLGLHWFLVFGCVIPIF